MSRKLQIVFLLLAAGACNGFVGEVHIDKPKRSPIRVIDPDYVILRPVSHAEQPGAISGTIYGRTIYYRPTDRIMDLRHFDLRTAKLEQSGPAEEYVVALHTTPQGNELLRSWTSRNIGKQLGVFVGGRLIDAPRIKTPITDMIVLEGSFSKSQAEDILARLHRGGAA